MTFEEDRGTVDALLVIGSVRFSASVNGTAAVISTGDILFDNVSRGRPAELLGSTERTFLSFGDLRVGKGRHLRGLLLAGGDVECQK